MKMSDVFHVCRLFFAFILLELVEHALGYDIHLRDRQPPGMVVFHGRVPTRDKVNVHYSFDVKRSTLQAQHLFSLSQYSGDVSLKTSPQCHSVLHNPFMVYLEIKATDLEGYTNYTLLPLSVFIHGENCFIKYKRKTHHQASQYQIEHGYETRPVQLISVQMSSQYGTCLQKDYNILKLSNYIPQKSIVNCQARYLGLQSTEFVLDVESGDLNIAELFCIYWPYKILQTSFHCGKLLVPVKIMLYAGDSLPIFTPRDDILDWTVLGNPYRPKGRSRRGASNTPPTFPQKLYVENVPEEKPAGYVINTISANDPDSEAAGRITYSLLATRDGRSQTMFAIDAASGQLTTTQRLDRESIQVHYFQIIATDNGQPAQSGYAALTIYVSDDNDHAPQFESEHYARSVSESISVGATILTVRASDEDSGSNAEIEYSILNPSGANDAFRIDSRIGSIITRQQLDRETRDSYRLEIQASDKALLTDRKTATSVVEITVLDENDNKPQFSKSSYTVDVSEDINPSGHPIIAEVKAEDADAGDNGMVRYSLTGSYYGNTFSIDPITGQLSIHETLDYESVAKYFLNVRAQDNGSPYKSNSTTITVNVLDVNDHDPLFYTSLYQESVMEDEPVGFAVLKVQAYDADSGLNSALLYSISDGAESDLPFEIDSITGELKIARLLDREKNARYSFRVESRDQGTPPRTATAAVEVHVIDINDNAPIFDPRVYSELVSEEAYPGSPVLAVTAADRDENARVTYSIQAGNVNHAFSIDSQMGQGLIRVARPLNYQDQSRYILTVVASDGTLEDTATVLINITDANTHRPMFQGTPYVIRVAEDKPVSTSIFKVLALDNDVGENAQITYTMDDNPSFRIDGETGELFVKSPLDRERTPGYTISVTATDHGRPAKSDTTDIEININDVNDNFPKFEQPVYEGQINEDALVGTSILTVSAHDDDFGLNSRIRYTFEGGDNGGGDFRIDPTLGDLRIAKELDRERTGSYELRAFAVDRGTPERSTSVVINIRVDDVNDNAPQFESPSVDLFIRENSPIGTSVDQILARDPDEGGNAVVDYSIIGGPDMDAFALTQRPGEPAVIHTKVELDYEGGQKTYNIVIRARSHHLFSDVNIVVHVQDINDNVPQMNDFVIIFNNYKDHFPTGEIGRIPAHDPDEYDELRYKFVSGNQANILHLNEFNGLIRLDSRLNSDVPTNATLLVSVSDGINEVKRSCRLFVRLITEEMLTNSTTVRLNGIDQSTFLTVGLYDMFVGALTNIIPSARDNIFIINVQDDTDVDTKVLNVSFAVRRQVVDNRDVFYPAQFLREKVYLQRELLAKLSELEVLPFDDNLCMVEPCFNFDECKVIQKFSNASGFIGSGTMLFRSIQPVNQFVCVCPEGYTGMNATYLCDAEVNLCYSNPCGYNGTCLPHEGGYSCQCHDGFTGDRCEIDMVKEKYKRCPDDVCLHGSRCVPLIRGGFRCEQCPPEAGEQCQDCADIPHRDRFCAMRTRSFSKGSFLIFPSLKRRYRFSLRLTFSTRERNALLLYNGRYNEKHDFVALEIIGGQVQFSFSLGSDVTRVAATVAGGVNDGQWHEVTVHYLNRTATLTVGEWCDTELSIKFGQTVGNYSCAARATKILEDRCVDPLVTCHRFLDLTGPLQLGGLPSLPADFQLQNSHFVGCIQDVHVDDGFLDLNDHVYNNNTLEGCHQKHQSCKTGAPCQNGGTCSEAWESYLCACESGWGGKDCSQKIEQERHLEGDGYLSFADHNLPDVLLPWYNGLSFRTRQKTALLFSIEVGMGTARDPKVKVNIEMVNGIVHYIHPEKTVVFDNVVVNDGQWHYLETRWMADNNFLFTLDYGQVKRVDTMGDWVVGRPIGRILVGGQEHKVGNTINVRNGFVGCLENIRVGNSPNSMLTRPDTLNAVLGCRVNDACADNPCSEDPDYHGYCVDEWGSHSCSCPTGRIGVDCDKVCEKYNPCAPGSLCRESASSSHGYVCECEAGRAGQYCDRALAVQCPASWWGSPLCGPCNCPVRRGFDANCNKTTGECYCREHHYRSPGGDTCYPCDCYSVGSLGPSCSNLTGQCACKSGVVGRRCHTCLSQFAEVTLRGCEVLYDGCPMSFSGSIWWPRSPLNITEVHSCPEGAVGNATRYCDWVNSWMEPDLSGCISRRFVKLREQMGLVERGALRMTAFLAKSLMLELTRATGSDQGALYMLDLKVAASLVNHVLRYENSQSGLNLTHTQDRNFMQNVVTSVGRMLSPDLRPHWKKINGNSPGAGELLYRLEEYSATLAANMHQLFMQPFLVVTDNMALGLDFAETIHNNSNVTFPKYNNIVRSARMFDNDTKITLPSELLLPRAEQGDPGFADSLLDDTAAAPDTVAGYILYRDMGDLLPPTYDESVRIQHNVSVSVNTPVLSINLHGNDGVTGNDLKKNPVRIEFRGRVSANRTSPQCMFWKFKHVDGVVSGEWSTTGCYLVDRKSAAADDESDQHEAVTESKVMAEAAVDADDVTWEYITCECYHMSSYAVLMDVSNQEYEASVALSLEVVTYVALALSLVCLLAALVVFCCLRRFNSNVNSIHTNLFFSLFVVQLLFMVGINRTEPVVACKIIAIGLHYFYICTFAWMFVETLHLYRMMTEIRNINEGSMKFYYVMGYVVPGIVVGLAVGLKTDGYGNPNFCFIRTTELLVWGFAGPVCCIFAVNVIVYLMALSASCRKRKGNPDFSFLKFLLRAGLVLLPLLGVAWVFGLLSVNDDVLAFHYLFAVFSFLQGLFILLAYVVFCKETRVQLRRQWYKLKGTSKELDESLNGTRASMLNRSALAYHQDSSLDGALQRMNIGVSTTTSSTSKSSGALYRPDGYLHTTSSTSTSGHMPGMDLPPNAGIVPYGWDPAYSDKKPKGRKPGDPDTGEKHRKRRDTDSDSELSALEHPDLELASSHSSDDDDEQFEWGKAPKRGKGRLKRRSKSQAPDKPVQPKDKLPLSVKLPPFPGINASQPSPVPHIGSASYVHAGPAPIPRNYAHADVGPAPMPSSPALGGHTLQSMGLPVGVSTPTKAPAIPPRPSFDRREYGGNMCGTTYQPQYNPTEPPPYLKSPARKWARDLSPAYGSRDVDIQAPPPVTRSPVGGTQLSHFSGGGEPVTPPRRVDSLPSPKLNGGAASRSSPKEVSFQVLSHNGSMTESEMSHETTV